MGFFKGATCYEGWLGPLWFAMPFWRFLKLGCRPRIGLDFGE